MRFKIFYTPDARADLRSIRSFIQRESGSARIASKYVGGILAEGQSLEVFPKRGTVRDGLGYRVIGVRGRVALHFEVLETSVVIHAVTYAGANWLAE